VAGLSQYPGDCIDAAGVSGEALVPEYDMMSHVRSDDRSHYSDIHGGQRQRASAYADRRSFRDRSPQLFRRARKRPSSPLAFHPHRYPRDKHPRLASSSPQRRYLATMAEERCYDLAGNVVPCDSPQAVEKGKTKQTKKLNPANRAHATPIAERATEGGDNGLGPGAIAALALVGAAALGSTAKKIIGRKRPRSAENLLEQEVGRGAIQMEDFSSINIGGRDGSDAAPPASRRRRQTKPSGDIFNASVDHPVLVLPPLDRSRTFGAGPAALEEVSDLEELRRQSQEQSRAVVRSLDEASLRREIADTRAARGARPVEELGELGHLYANRARELGFDANDVQGARAARAPFALEQPDLDNALDNVDPSVPRAFLGRPLHGRAKDWTEEAAREGGERGKRIARDAAALIEGSAGPNGEHWSSARMRNEMELGASNVEGRAGGENYRILRAAGRSSSEAGEAAALSTRIPRAASQSLGKQLASAYSGVAGSFTGPLETFNALNDPDEVLHRAGRDFSDRLLGQRVAPGPLVELGDMTRASRRRALDLQVLEAAQRGVNLLLESPDAAREFRELGGPRLSQVDSVIDRAANDFTPEELSNRGIDLARAREGTNRKDFFTKAQSSFGVQHKTAIASVIGRAQELMYGHHADGKAPPKSFKLAIAQATDELSRRGGRGADQIKALGTNVHPDDILGGFLDLHPTEAEWKKRGFSGHEEIYADAVRARGYQRTFLQQAGNLAVRAMARDATTAQELRDAHNDLAVTRASDPYDWENAPESYKDPYPEYHRSVKQIGANAVGGTALAIAGGATRSFVTTLLQATEYYKSQGYSDEEARSMAREEAAEAAANGASKGATMGLASAAIGEGIGSLRAYGAQRRWGKRNEQAFKARSSAPLAWGAKGAVGGGVAGAAATLAEPFVSLAQSVRNAEIPGTMRNAPRAWRNFTISRNAIRGYRNGGGVRGAATAVARGAATSTVGLARAGMAALTGFARGGAVGAATGAARAMGGGVADLATELATGAAMGAALGGASGAAAGAAYEAAPGRARRTGPTPGTRSRYTGDWIEDELAQWDELPKWLGGRGKQRDRSPDSRLEARRLETERLTGARVSREHISGPGRDVLDPNYSASSASREAAEEAAEKAAKKAAKKVGKKAATKAALSAAVGGPVGLAVSLLRGITQRSKNRRFGRREDLAEEKGREYYTGKYRELYRPRYQQRTIHEYKTGEDLSHVQETKFGQALNTASTKMEQVKAGKPYQATKYALGVIGGRNAVARSMTRRYERRADLVANSDNPDRYYVGKFRHASNKNVQNVGVRQARRGRGSTTR